MAFDLTEKRYIKETGLEARIARIVEPVANGLGYSLVRIKITPENGCTLQIMAEDAEGRFTINDCEALSKDLSPVLDVEDPIDREYHLEVSSAGIDRPLVRKRDFERYLGHEAKVELLDMINGRKRFRGLIQAVDADGVTIRLPDAPAGTDPATGFRLIASGRGLAPTRVECSDVCTISFDTSSADGASRVLFYERGDQQARWVLG